MAVEAGGYFAWDTLAASRVAISSAAAFEKCKEDITGSTPRFSILEFDSEVAEEP